LRGADGVMVIVVDDLETWRLYILAGLTALLWAEVMSCVHYRRECIDALGSGIVLCVK
jgi:hypothetical protein